MQHLRPAPCGEPVVACPGVALTVHPKVCRVSLPEPVPDRYAGGVALDAATKIAIIETPHGIGEPIWIHQPQTRGVSGAFVRRPLDQRGTVTIHHEMRRRHPEHLPEVQAALGIHLERMSIGVRPELHLHLRAEFARRSRINAERSRIWTRREPPSTPHGCILSARHRRSADGIVPHDVPGPRHGRIAVWDPLQIRRSDLREPVRHDRTARPARVVSRRQVERACQRLRPSNRRGTDRSSRGIQKGHKASPRGGS